MGEKICLGFRAPRFRAEFEGKHFFVNDIPSMAFLQSFRYLGPRSAFHLAVHECVRAYSSRFLINYFA